MLTQQPFRVVLTDYFVFAANAGEPDQAEACVAALAEGAYGYLAKPFRLQDLWDVVQPALQGLPAPGANRFPRG